MITSGKVIEHINKVLNLITKINKKYCKMTGLDGNPLSGESGFQGQSENVSLNGRHKV